MTKLKDPLIVFETWLENLRQDFEIKNFKDFRNEMFELIKENKDLSSVELIVEKYMRKE